MDSGRPVRNSGGFAQIESLVVIAVITNKPN
jgi:hypothetical protein